MSGALTVVDRSIAAALVALVLGAGAIRLVPGVVGVLHDDGVYAITAKALAEGHGYRLINLPGSPRQTKYPILYPAILAVVWTVWPEFPANGPAMQWVTLAAAAAAIGLTYLFLVGCGLASRAVAAASAALCGLVPMFLHLSTLTMSESSFALLIVIALWRAQAELRATAPRPRRHQFVTGVTIALPLLCRGFGVAILAGVLVTFVRAKRPVAWVFAGSAAVLGAWAAWVGLGSGAPDSVVRYYTSYEHSAAATFGPHGLRIIGMNVLLILTSSVGLALDGLRRMAEPVGVVMVQLFLLAGVATWWAIVRRAVQGQLVATCLLVYGGLAVGWPWPPPRFLVPILPLLVATAFTWLGHIVAPLLAGNSSRQRVVTITAAALVVVALVGHGRHLMATAARNRQAGYPFDVGFTRGGTTLPTWQQYLDLFAWIRANTRETDVLACGLDTMIFLYTGRQGFRPAVYRPESGYGVDVSPVGSAEEVRSLLERGRAQYLILVPGYSDREALARTVAEIRRSEPGFFQKVYGEMEDSFAVYRIQARVSARGPTGR